MTDTPRPLRSAWSLATLAAALATAALCLLPWRRVRSHDLFGIRGEIPAYLTPPGLATLVAAALVALLVVIERTGPRDPEPRRALATGCAFVAAVATTTPVMQLIKGPGDLRSLPLEFTEWFYLGLGAAAVMVLAAGIHWRTQDLPPPELRLVPDDRAETKRQARG
ncbi:MAG: hypothetical protein AAF628_38110 [Planctomycetota bacterium]